MSHKIEEAIENLAALAPCQPTEIRIAIKGGVIQKIERGENISQAVIVTVSDYDTEGMSPHEIEERCFLDGKGSHCIYEEVVAD